MASWLKGEFRWHTLFYVGVAALLLLMLVIIADKVAGLFGVDIFARPAASPHARIVYLAPADDYASNLYLIEPETGTVTQITAATEGIENFAVSPDGAAIAYAQNNADGTADLWVLDLRTDSARPVTRCVAARCTRPSWHPDSTQLVYQRTEFSERVAMRRAWIVDVQTVQTHLLFEDEQQLGAEPTWSPDGTRIAIYDANMPGIRIYHTTTHTNTFIESYQEHAGVFSPDGSQFVYPILVQGNSGQQFYTHLERVNLDTNTRTPISAAETAPIEDNYAAWSPDGTALLLARRYLDERFTPGQQLYLLTLATGDITPLVVDATYNHAGMQWEPTGRRIVFQRFAWDTPDARPEIWTYHLDTGELVRVAENAYWPAWVP